MKIVFLFSQILTIDEIAVEYELHMKKTYYQFFLYLMSKWCPKLPTDVV